MDKMGWFTMSITGPLTHLFPMNLDENAVRDSVNHSHVDPEQSEKR